MKKEYIIGAVALAAVVGGYLWYKSTKKDVVADTPPAPPADPLEGKLISIGNTEGKYAGAGVFKYFKGKKYVYPSPAFDQFVESNTKNGAEQYAGLVILSQAKFDAIPLDGAVGSPESIYGSAKLIGLYQGKDVSLGNPTSGAYTSTSGSFYRIKGDKKYAWSSADWTALTNKTNQLAVTQDVLNLFTDGGAFVPTASFAGKKSSDNKLGRNYFDTESSTWLRADGQIFANADGQIFANMVQPFSTQNCGNVDCWS
jgi:hypothetical protein